MSQFRKTGTYYVSQWNGDDLNAGTDPTLPKATISSLASSTNLSVVGSGTYKGIGSGNRRLIADGAVVVDFLGAVISGSQQYEGIIIRNMDASSGALAPSFRRCIIDQDIFATIHSDEVPTPLLGGRGVHDCCFLKNFRHRVSTLSRLKLYNASCFGSIFNADDSGGNVLWIQDLSLNFFSKNTTVYLLQTSIDDVTTVFIDNCICGPVKIGSTIYELKKDINGNTRSDTNGSLPDVIAVWPDVYTNGNFASADPRVLDEAYRVVDQASDLLKKQNNFGYIGGVKAGKYFTIEDENFTVTFENIEEVSAGVYKIEAGQDFGKIRMTGKVSNTLISLQKLNIRIPLNFDGDEIGGTAGNNNVPDAYNGLLGSDVLGDLPERLRFEIRTSQLSNANRTTSSDWDNGFIGNSGQFYLMEYGQPLTFHDVAGTIYGNANKTTINPDSVLPFFYRSIDLVITLTNTREI